MELIMATLGILICLPLACFVLYIMWRELLKQWRADFGKKAR